MQIRNKIVLIFMLVTCVTLLLLSLFIYIFSVRNSHKFFYTRLKIRASIALQGYLEEGKSDVMMEVRERHLEILPREYEEIVLFDSLARKWNKEPLTAEFEQFYDEVNENGYSEFQRAFVHYVGMMDTQAPGVISIASAYDEEAVDQLTSLGRLLIIGFGLSCILVFVLGRFLAFQIIKPVSDIIKEVNRINASSLDTRLTTAKGSDEIAALAQTFNNLLDRLHTAFQLQSNFIGNASHELRTPLTTILGESDFILSGQRKTEDYRQSIETIRIEAEKLNDLVTSLLDLSQVGFDGKRQMLEPINIDLLLMKIKSQINKRLPVNFLQIKVKNVPENPDALVLMCIPSWIELAFMNIINNAIKYSDNKEVTVALSATDEDLTIQIEDLGIGISEVDISHVFELFFRGSNAQPYIGYGVGLPLADKIIRLHGGSIAISSQPHQGTIVTVRFDRRKVRN